MKHRFVILIFAMAFCALCPPSGSGAIIFRPGQKTRILAPGEEEVNGNAQQLYAIADEAEKAGNPSRAVKALRKLVRSYPRDTLAPGAGFRVAQLEEQATDFTKAAADYRFVIERYPQSSHFNEAMEGQFRIGEMYLNGKKRKVFGLSIGRGLSEAVEIFAAIVRTAPYGRYTARAQFDIGRAREKQGQNEAAVAAYQAVVDKFPNDPIAVEAQYQIGYIWFSAARAGTSDSNAVANAKTGFQDFLFRYPKNEKAAQARQDLDMLAHKATASSFNIARFYDKQKNYRAAVIYYNDVIRQQPGSTEGDRAKRRVDELRARVGEAALKTAFSSETPKRTARRTARAEAGEQSETPSMRGVSPNDIAPLPPAETDLSLPPPASLAPDTTTAPDLSTAPADWAAPEPSATPAASPDASP
ncbi:MAG: outer membrane protein assembly factor BamD [Chthoniobacterales bacterium]|nr:outer membrane protein assembly factor BamD [Chthoniobacterales bacterium]